MSPSGDLPRSDADAEQGRPLVEAVAIARSFARRRGILARLTGAGSDAPVQAVRGVDLAIHRGETLALVGESGSGKSTIARMLVGLLRPTAGHVMIDGRDLWQSPGAGRGRLQLVFQNPYASLNPRWRVGSIIAEPIRARGGADHAAAIASRVGALLAEVGLEPADGRRYPREFSGGERQRIAIARALAGEPDVLVADEPTSSLDVSVQAQILNLLLRLKRERRLATLLISHDLAVVRHMADRIGVLYAGRLVETGPAAQILAHPRHPYTRMLVDAVPDPRTRREPRVIPGDPPDPRSPLPGCSFRPRCPHAVARCALEAPSLTANTDTAVDTAVACHVV